MDLSGDLFALGEGIYLFVDLKGGSGGQGFSLDTVDILGQVILLGAVMYNVGFLAAFLLSLISCTLSHS